MFSRCQIDQCCPQSVEVAGGNRTSPELLRRHVAVGADHGDGAFLAGGQDANGAKVDEVNGADVAIAAIAQQDVARFDIPMNDRGAALVEVCQNCEQLAGELLQIRFAEGTPRLQVLLQRLGFDIGLHEDKTFVVRLVQFEGIEIAGNFGAIEIFENFCFPFEQLEIGPLKNRDRTAALSRRRDRPLLNPAPEECAGRRCAPARLKLRSDRPACDFRIVRPCHLIVSQ